MLNQKQVLKLENFAKKLIGEDADKFDIKSEISVNLNIAENKRILYEKIQKLFPIDEKITKVYIDTDKEMISHYNQQELLKEEERAEDEFENSIKQLEVSKVSKEKIINEIFKYPIEYVKSVARGYHNSFIYLGKQGQGKTTTTLKQLENEKVEYVYHSGISTPKALYEFLFENRKNKVIVFDDCAGLINNYYALSIMLSALWSPTDIRKVTWNSTRGGKINIPNKFIFNSRIIVVTNKIPNNDYAKVVMSRCLLYKQNLPYQDIIKLMYAICKDKEIVDYIKENSSEFTENFDLRLLKKAEKFKEYDKNNWQDLLKPMLDEIDKELKYLKECLNRHSSVDSAQKEWSEKFGSRTTFFRRKKLYERDNL